MKTLFTRIHRESIERKALPLYFPERLRFSLLEILKKWSDEGQYETYATLDAAEYALRIFYGQPHLWTYSSKGERVPGTIGEALLRGYPGTVLDILEAYFDQNPENATQCEAEVNTLLAMHDSPWRVINGSAILIDSEYLHESVRTRSFSLLKTHGALGALEEFEAAVRDLQAGELKDAVVKAHKSVESVMKTVLGVTEHLTFGELLARLIKSGIIPEYYDEFLKHFEKLSIGAVKERNLPGRGHGQGSDPMLVPRTLANFAVNLAGSLNVFMIQEWASRRGETSSRDEEQEVPF